MNTRPCTYCPEPGATVCVRTHPTLDVFAHDECARAHGDQVLYRVLEPEAAR